VGLISRTLLALGVAGTVVFSVALSLGPGPGGGGGGTQPGSPGGGAAAEVSAPNAPSFLVYNVDDATVYVEGSAFVGSGGDTHDSTMIVWDSVGQSSPDTLLSGPQIHDTISTGLDSAGVYVIREFLHKGASGGWSGSQADSIMFVAQDLLWVADAENHQNGDGANDIIGDGPSVGEGHYEGGAGGGLGMTVQNTTVHRGSLAFELDGDAPQLWRFYFAADTVGDHITVYVERWNFYFEDFYHDISKWKGGNFLVGCGNGYNGAAGNPSSQNDSACWNWWGEVEAAASGCEIRDHHKYATGSGSSGGSPVEQYISGHALLGTGQWDICVVLEADLGRWIREVQMFTAATTGALEVNPNGTTCIWKGHTFPTPLVYEQTDFPLGGDSAYIANGGTTAGASGVTLSGAYDGGAGTALLHRAHDDITVYMDLPPGLEEGCG
jgi:hypothetical protein